MAKFNVSVPHVLDRADVIGRLRGFADRVRVDSPIEISDLNEKWDSAGNLEFSFKAMGYIVSGAMETTDRDIKVTGKLPLAAALFRGAIENQIASKIREAIA